MMKRTELFDSEMDPQAGDLTCWLLDTRTLWPGEKIEHAAKDVLQTLPTSERENCLRKMFISDARLSLGSALLKRLYVSHALKIPWRDVKLSRKGDPKHGKPCAVLKDGTPAPIDFNVSHQAGLVALVGWAVSEPQGEALQVGVDIVCVNERDDYRSIDQEGFDGWVDIYEEVFSDEERWDMKYNVDSVTLLDGTTISGDGLGRGDRCVRRDEELTATLPSGQQVNLGSEILIDAKLRRFYSFFCYKEAYIKLAGEALLAPWLKRLEFQNVRSPRAGTVARCSTHGTWGEKVKDVEVLLHGKRVTDVEMELQAFEENYMIATAVKGPSLPQMPSFQKLNLEHDIMAHASNM